MAKRLVEIMAPVKLREHLDKLARNSEPDSLWSQCDDDSVLHRVVLPAERVEALLDPLAQFMSLNEGIRVIVLQVGATLPLEDIDEEQGTAVRARIGQQRISREELVNELGKAARLDRSYVVFVVLSTIVAAIGLYRSSAAIVIGAMVIAPLMGPNMALALATTLGDGKLAKRAFKTAFAGFAYAFLLAFALGFAVKLTEGTIPTNWLIGPTEMSTRISPHWSDAILAIASGAAGALAYTTGVPTSLVGVMVAVALMPPLVVMASFLAFQHADATRAALLLATNIAGINFAGIATFLIQGVRPRSWWDARRSAKSARIALTVWALVLIALTVMIVIDSR